MPPTLADACAALGLGGSPLGRNFCHVPDFTSNTCTSFVAPAKRTPEELLLLLFVFVVAFAFLSVVVVVAFEEEFDAFSNAVAPPNATNLCTPSHCKAVNVCPHRGPGWSDEVSWHKPWNSAESILVRVSLSALMCGKKWFVEGASFSSRTCLGCPTLSTLKRFLFSLKFSNLLP